MTKETEIKNIGVNRVSNSRLSVNKFDTPLLNLSFDRITIVGDLQESDEQSFSDFIANNVYIKVYESHTSQAKGRSVDEGFYFEYDKAKGKTLCRRNIRIEFNPNNISNAASSIIKKEFISKMTNISFSRLDLAFDFDIDLSDFYILSDKAIKQTVFYGRDGKAETKYFGVRSSDRYIRIYNKKQEIKDNKDLEIELPNYWRIEFELKRDMTGQWQNCFDDLHILKPDWQSVENQKERAMVYMLLHVQNEWGKLSRPTKYKYRKILKEISSIDLKNKMQEELNFQREKLQKELDFWLA